MESKKLGTERSSLVLYKFIEACIHAGKSLRNLFQINGPLWPKRFLP